MKITRLGTCFSLGCLASSLVADIPRPDALVYGTVELNGQMAMAADDITVVARVRGLNAPIAAYHIGAQPTAEDKYVLWIPQAVLDDGTTPPLGYAMPGNVAKIYVKQGDGPEVYFTDVIVPNSGEVKRLDLKIGASELTAQGVPNSGSGGACGQGACGALGMVSVLLMFCGLVQMKYRRTSLRRECR